MKRRKSEREEIREIKRTFRGLIVHSLDKALGCIYYYKTL